MGVHIGGTVKVVELGLKDVLHHDNMGGASLLGERVGEESKTIQTGWRAGHTHFEAVIDGANERGA